jgi:hypothetical protein
MLLLYSLIYSRPLQLLGFTPLKLFFTDDSLKDAANAPATELGLEFADTFRNFHIYMPPVYYCNNTIIYSIFSFYFLLFLYKKFLT